MEVSDVRAVSVFCSRLNFTSCWIESTLTCGNAAACASIRCCGESCVVCAIATGTRKISKERKAYTSQIVAMRSSIPKRANNALNHLPVQSGDARAGCDEFPGNGRLGVANERFSSLIAASQNRLVNRFNRMRTEPDVHQKRRLRDDAIEFLPRSDGAGGVRFEFLQLIPSLPKQS